LRNSKKEKEKYINFQRETKKYHFENKTNKENETKKGRRTKSGYSEEVIISDRYG